VTKAFKSAGPTVFQNFVFILVVTFARLSKKLSKKFITVAEILEFHLWVRGNFPKAKFFLRREQAWWQISVFTKENDIRIIELGVAWGYATNWFLTNAFPRTALENQPQIKMDSFDLFTGMPRKWRNHDEGAFSNSGELPNIVDHRLTFHKGFIEETIQVLNLDQLKESTKIILFDLDLYDPTLFAYQYLKASLNPGDILYFDEAFDSDEREVIRSNLIREFEVAVVAYTPLALALVIVCRKVSTDE
jgi:hypothetical protein